MKLKSIILNIVIISIILNFLFLVSCRDSSIFWILSQTTKEEDHSLDNEFTITDMSDDNTSNYIAAGGSMWMRDIDASSDDNWTSVKFPSGVEYCTAMTIMDDNDIYAGFLHEEGAEKSAGLYKAGLSGFSAEGPGWVLQVDGDGDMENLQIIRLIELNSKLFISTKNMDDLDVNGKYDLYYLDGNDYIKTGLADENEAITDITWDEAGKYWAITYSVTGDNSTDMELEPKIFTLEDSNLTNPAVKVENTKHVKIEEDNYKPRSLYGGIFYSSPKIFVSDKNGYIYETEDGNTWNINTEQIKYNDSDTYGIIFSGFARVKSLILVGTLGHGFYNIKGNDVNKIEAPDVNDSSLFINTELDDSQVIRFHVQNDEKVFFCTAGDGLYSNTFNGTSWDENWIHE